MSSSNQEENRSNAFINRLIEIPLIKSFSQTIVSTYGRTKNSNRLINYSLEKTEEIVKYANRKAEPIKQLFDRPVNLASDIADKQLQWFQRHYPIINSTPDEISKYGQNLYEKSVVKRGIDGVSTTKEWTVATITDYRDRLLKSAQAGQATINRYANGVLDFTEGIIDKYIASPDSKKRPGTSTNNSYVQRLFGMANKMVDGSKYRVTIAFNKTKTIAISGIERADELIQYTKNAAISTIQNTISNAIRIRDAILTEIANRTRSIKDKSDSAAVYVTKTLTNGVADISDRVVASTTPHLPEGLQKPTVSFVQYVHHWQDRVGKATSTSDVLKAAADETKQNLRFARELFQSLLNNGDTQVKEKRW